MFLYGFVGSAPCGGLLLEKLQACTQPGLDGYGAALMQGGELLCVKSKESVAALAQQLPESAAPCGLVHARFATCGGCTAENVHPFVTDDYCLAMNGTVENAVALRSALNLLPYPDSDGAVLAALLQAYADSGTVAALRLCCREARGNYALAVLRRGEECLFACAHGAPLYAAVGGGSACVSSDLAALEPDQMKIYALSAGECVQLRPGKLQFWNAKGKKIKKSPCAVTLRRPPAAGFADPGEALQALPGDLELLLHRFVRGDQPRLGKSRLRPRGISRVLLVGCGTSYQLAQAAACNFESVCDVPAFAYSAGEFCAGGVVCDRGALVVGISASGQTAEVAEALQKAAAFGARTASLTGDPDSPLARAGGTLLSLPCSLPGGLPPVTHFVLGYVLLALVAVVGLWIGNVKIRGVGFGIGGVLFGGIIVGHFVDQAGVALSSPMLHFIQEFGLILFVYTIGIQVGPGFFASLRVSGLRLNLFAILIVILGGLVTAVLHKLFNIPLPVVLGIFSGAVTNTPALGAGQQILRDLGVPFEVVDQMGMSYAMAYPFGICGILLTMWLVRLFFRINIEKEAQRFEESSGNGHAHLHTINVRVENPNLNQMAIQDVPMLNSDNIVCSRLKRGELLMVPAPGTLIQAGDLLHLVGRPEDLHNAQLVIGQEVATSLSTRGTDLKVERVVVTNEKVLGKKIRDLQA